jgi:hypothetical protein
MRARSPGVVVDTAKNDAQTPAEAGWHRVEPSD